MLIFPLKIGLSANNSKGRQEKMDVIIKAFTAGRPLKQVVSIRQGLKMIGNP
jgi:hypothetical protein